ncbi:MAG: hypothetical protein R3B07_21745 [Polyangiaceae bacterium]
MLGAQLDSPEVGSIPQRTRLKGLYTNLSEHHPATFLGSVYQRPGHGATRPRRSEGQLPDRPYLKAGSRIDWLW